VNEKGAKLYLDAIQSVEVGVQIYSMIAPVVREVSHLLKLKVGHLFEGPTSLRMYTRLRSCMQSLIKKK
jgi:hypothetical protein